MHNKWTRNGHRCHKMSQTSPCHIDLSDLVKSDKQHFFCRTWDTTSLDTVTCPAKSRRANLNSTADERVQYKRVRDLSARLQESMAYTYMERDQFRRSDCLNEDHTSKIIMHVSLPRAPTSEGKYGLSVKATPKHGTRNWGRFGPQALGVRHALRQCRLHQLGPGPRLSFREEQM